MNVCTEVSSEDCQSLSQRLNAAKRDSVIVIVGRMDIDYTGRASSYAPPAHRLLVLKPDGVLLVHESVHVDPLNWQPPGSLHHIECVDNRLRVRSVRRSPREEVVIEFENVEFVKLCKLASTKLSVIGRESDVVKAITLNPSVIEEGSSVVGTDIATPYGKVDVLLRKGGRLIVVEVKNEKAGAPAIAQLKRYVEYYLAQGYTASGVLVAPGLAREAWAMLNREGFRYVDLNKLMSHNLKRPTLENFINIGKG